MANQDSLWSSVKSFVLIGLVVYVAILIADLIVTLVMIPVRRFSGRGKDNSKMAQVARVMAKNAPRSERKEDVSDYLNGRLADEGLSHTPMEFIGEQENPNYSRYLEAQLPMFQEGSPEHKWLSAQIERIVDRDELVDAADEYARILKSRGVDEAYLEDLFTTTRMKEFSTSDWLLLVDSIKAFEAAGLVQESILIYIRNQVRCLDLNEAKLVDHLHRLGVPEKDIVRSMDYDLNIDQIYKAYEVCTDRRCSWDDALAFVKGR